MITGDVERTYETFMTHKENVVLLKLHLSDLSFMLEEMFARLFAIFDNHRMHINLVHNSAVYILHVNLELIMSLFMIRNKFLSCPTIRFRRFSNCLHAVFCSLHRQVSIGVLTFSTLLFANTESVSAQTDYQQGIQQYEMEEVKVTGSRVPLSLSQAARVVTVLDGRALADAPVQSINDLLKYAVGVDVRQRGGRGIQTDISIRGGTFDQITILLNGINICDPQTGHNAADFPIDIEDIERIEILEGPAGRVYGTSSLVGAINIVTRKAQENFVEVRADGGSYGSWGGGVSSALVGKKLRNQVSASWHASDGFSRNQEGRLNSDHRIGKLFYQGSYSHPEADIQWHAGVGNKDFGANTFYSAKYDDQFEHFRKYYTAVQAETKGFLHFKPAIYWNRSEDRFELFRNNPEKTPYNYHRTDVFGLNLNSYFSTRWGKTAFGAEMRHESIISTNLGEPLGEAKDISGKEAKYTHGLNRTHISFHLEHNLLLPRFTLSAGLIAVKNSGNGMNFRIYPGIDASYRLASDWKIYASYNESLRMPTFTELYYSVGGHQADKNLKPEEMKALELGVKYRTSAIRSVFSLYHHWGSNMIDWILDTRQEGEALWQSVNHTKLNTAGVEATLQFIPTEVWGERFPCQNLQVGYSFITQSKKQQEYIQSLYALEYLRHKLVAQADFRLYRMLKLNVAYRWQDRVGNYSVTDYVSGESHLQSYRPYGVLDCRLTWDAPSYRFYVEAANILNKKYYDHGNIPQPGIWITVGVQFRHKFF